MIFSSVLKFAWIFLIVLTRSDRPSSAKYSHCIGMITPCAAQKPLRVSRDSEGGQSIRTKSYWSSTAASASLRRVSRSSKSTSSTSAPASSRLAGTTA